MSRATPLPLPRHIATLDVLRFVAAMAVVAYHFLFRGAVDSTFTSVGFDTGRLLGIGVEHLYLGVHLFFVVSGFVIMASVRDRDALSFAIARFVRLWPVFALSVTITAVALWTAGDARYPISLAQWAANLTFFGPVLGQPFVDGVYWSIVLELVFYGWVALMILTGVLPRYVLAFATVWLVLAAGNELFLDSGAARLVLATRFAPWFLFGILLHHAITRGMSGGSMALLFATVALSMWNVAHEQFEIAAEYGIAADMRAVLALNAALLLAFLAALRLRFALAPTAWLASLGALTYPLYLLHQNIGYIAIERMTPVIGKHAAVAGATILALALAWIITERFDRPARRALRALIEGVLSAIPLVGLRRAA